MSIMPSVRRVCGTRKWRLAQFERAKDAQLPD